MSDRPSQHVVIASQLTAAADLQTRILDDVQAAGFSERAQFAIRLALDEAFANAIHHGNHDDPTKTLEVEYTVDPERFVISITDQGPGFQPEDVPDPTLAENIDKPNGRGVMLMRAYMTDVRFNEEGNTVTMVKTADCALPDAD